MSWEAVIGLETHVELSTRSKMFCGCPARFDAPPNTNVCPVCLGLPGALPVPNREAINRIIRIGLALNCSVTGRSVFHRKNYFYADLPKNYQISQFDLPVCVDGYLDVAGDHPGRVGIERSIRRRTPEEHPYGRRRPHQRRRIFTARFQPFGGSLGRDSHQARHPLCGPGPGLRAGAEAAGRGPRGVRRPARRGSIRFDANVSVRPGSEAPLGTKVEIKNMNSFRSLERAVAFEIGRQTACLDGGERIVMETRHWDEEAGVTRGGRTKEGSSDYRYFPDPDLVPLDLDQDWKDEMAALLPELPARRRSRYEGMGIDPAQAATLAGADVHLRGLFEGAVEAGGAAAAGR